MKQTVLALSAAVVAFVGAAGILHAADPAPAGMPHMDMNRTVARADMLAHADQMFAAMDVNKDGKIDQADRAARQAEKFDRIDADKNGQISRSEFAGQRPPAPPAAQPGMGQPGMGQPGMGQQGMGEPGMRGHGGHGGRRMGAGMSGGMGMMVLRMADADKDGAVTKAEYTAAATRHFDQVDTNKDGQITPQERQAAHAGMRDRMREIRGGRGGHDGHDMPSPPPSAGK